MNLIVAVAVRLQKPSISNLPIFLIRLLSMLNWNINDTELPHL